MDGYQNWSRDSLSNYTDNFLVSPANPVGDLIFIMCQEKCFRNSFCTVSRHSTYFQRPGIYAIDDQTPETIGACLYFNERLVLSPDPERTTPFSSNLPDSWEMKTTLSQKLHLWDICGSFGNYLLRRYVEEHIGDILANWRHYYSHPVVHHRLENPEWCILDNFGAAYQLCIDMRWDLQASAIVQSFVQNITNDEWEEYEDNLVDESLAFFWHAENGLAELRERLNELEAVVSILEEVLVGGATAATVTHLQLWTSSIDNLSHIADAECGTDNSGTIGDGKSNDDSKDLGSGEYAREDLASTSFETHELEDGDLNLLPVEVSNISLSPVRTLASV